MGGFLAPPGPRRTQASHSPVPIALSDCQRQRLCLSRPRGSTPTYVIFTLPAGFCAVVVADQWGPPAPGGAAKAICSGLAGPPWGQRRHPWLRDTSGDGKADVQQDLLGRRPAPESRWQRRPLFGTASTVYRYAMRRAASPRSTPGRDRPRTCPPRHSAKNLALAPTAAHCS